MRSGAGPQRQERPRHAATLSRAGPLPSGHAPAQACCNRCSHGRPPVLCTLHANACAHGADVKSFTYPSIHTGALLPWHSHTDAHDCVHTSPCIPWRAHTWHAGTRAHTATPTPAARPRHLPCPSPPRRRRAVAASAPPQHARIWRHSASWCARTGEQACGQRRGHSDKSGLGRRRRSPAQGTLHSGHAPAQAHCNRGSHGRPPVLCTLHANACAHGPDGKAFTYPSVRVSTSHA